MIALSNINPDEKVFSDDFIQKNNIGPVSSVQRIIKSLLEKDLIEKPNGNYEITDIVFKKWLRKTYFEKTI